jgi:hypothetical protein
MEYGDWDIELVAEDEGFRGRVKRLDNRHFTLPGTKPHVLFRHAETIIYQAEEEAIKNAWLIADAGRPNS